MLLRASGFGPEGMLRLTGSRLARRLDAPLPSLFWAAGLSFSRARLLQEVRALSQAPTSNTCLEPFICTRWADFFAMMPSAY